MGVRLRLATPADAPSVRLIYAPFVRDTHVSFETDVPSVEVVAERIARYGAARPWLVAEAPEAEVAGYAYATGHRDREAYQWSCEVSVYVAPAWQRRGVARALYTALFDVLRLQGYVNAYAGIAQPNPVSVAFHEALGFEPVGVYRRVGFKRGAWRDVGWWALRLREAPAPRPPRALDAVSQTAAFEQALREGEQHIR